VQPPPPAPAADTAYYWVGVGGVLAGLCIYFLAPETYRLFGVILAVYGTLTIAGKSVWSLMQKRPRSQEYPRADYDSIPQER
jgi:phage shock protein PspC (stress-responsive transcriptional regulator)